MFNFEPAQKATMYFIGVTTAKSSIMTVFPHWAEALGLGSVDIKGIDLPLHAPAEDYRKAVSFIKADPLSMGALVTTHKLDLFSACKDMFDYIDPYAKKLSEVSSLSKRGGAFKAHAKDPISSGLALERFVPINFWRDHGGQVLLLGSGGSSLAMSLYFAQDKFNGNKPAKVIMTNRSQPRLDSAEKHLAGIGLEMEFVLSAIPMDNDKLVAKLPPYSLVVNATGLGKDAPGSPTTDEVDYPQNSLVWEINYRGDLVFKNQAERQAKTKNLHVEDGWDYFIYGWTQVIAEVFNVSIDGETLQRLSDIAKKA